MRPWWWSRPCCWALRTSSTAREPRGDRLYPRAALAAEGDRARHRRRLHRPIHLAMARGDDRHRQGGRAHVSTRGGSRCAQAYGQGRSEEHTSELQSLMRISYAVFCLKKKKK